MGRREGAVTNPSRSGTLAPAFATTAAFAGVLGLALDEMSAAETSDHDNIDLRREIARLASILRYQRARESELIYEAYYDAFNTELDI